ncbi:MAG TPA: glucose-1-phosphate cytidylyltransferase [Candidatus Sulfotelmatobacter sp.]|nr:glucose-1-phosphate cytidylyltransferase [Candidatus Sulfotelmatobacter sp.]
MRVFILAGGLGARLSEETAIRPKPMVEIGDQPVIWHIMKMYAACGFEDFVVLCGYKGHVIKEYFATYALRRSDVAFDFSRNGVEIIKGPAERWKVTLLDTGEDTNIGGRIRRARGYTGDATFCVTYGDTVSDVDVNKEIAFHRSHGKLATMMVTQPPGRFGAVLMPKGRDEITRFQEKPGGDGAWVNGGFFVLEPGVIDYIDGDAADWGDVLERLARDGHLVGYRHRGFWHPMDTLPDKKNLETMWKQGRAPWKTW